IGAGGAVPAAEGVDQARVDRAQVVVTEAEPLHHAGPEVVHQNVGLAGEPIDRLTTERRADVDRDAALVAIQAPEHGTLAARVFHVHAGEIAGARPLDLDDVGAEVAQHLRRARPQLDLGEVEDRHASERSDVLQRPDHLGALLSRNAFTPSTWSSEASARAIVGGTSATAAGNDTLSPASTASFVACTDSGAQSRISCAHLRAAGSRSASGTTSLTRPSRCASLAVMRRPVSSMAIAVLSGIDRASRCMPPSSAIRPTRGSGKP